MYKKSLKEFAISEQGVISQVLGEGRLRRRLLDMGLTPGASIQLKKKAPLGDPLLIEVRGYSLSLRQSDAESILIECL